jgi:hypothetical protein
MVDGVSLDAHRAKVAAWADLNDYEIGGSFEDADISGIKTARPGPARPCGCRRCPVGLQSVTAGPFAPARTGHIGTDRHDIRGGADGLSHFGRAGRI